MNCNVCEDKKTCFPAQRRACIQNKEHAFKGRVVRKVRRLPYQGNMAEAFRKASKSF
jgi:hypothetical protein